jgi:tetratricopeptide (TPR) repeat protein
VSKSRKPRASREAPRAAVEQPIAPTRWQRIWRPHGRRLLALWAFVFIAYSNSFQAGLVFDNGPVILHDPRIQSATLDNAGRILTTGYWHVVPSSGLYRPITTLSYLVNYAVLDDGPNPSGYHSVNLALHCANASLVYALGILVLDAPALALALAALWGLHPLLTESVTNVVGRADLLAAFGVLAGLLCYSKSLAASGRNRLPWLSAAVAAQTIGLFSKESAAVLPGVMLLYDLTWSERSTWRRRAPAYAAIALPFGLFFLLRAASHAHMLIGFNENPMVSAGFWTARLTAVKVMGKLLWLFAWPAGLSADHSYNAVPLFGWRLSSWEDAKALIALVVAVSAIATAFVLRRRSKPAFFFLLFFFIAFVPTSNFLVLIGSIMAERFMYLPSVGLAGCVVLGLHASVRRLSLKSPGAARIEWVAIGIVCLAFAARTHARNLDWRDELSLWSSAVSVVPDSATAHMNLGHALSELPGRLPESMAEYKTALRIQPDYAQAHYNLGVAFARMPGRLSDAIGEFQAAIRIQPDYTDATYNLGTALAKMPGRMPDAIAAWQTTLRFQPDHAGAHNNLGNALSKMPGRMPDAIAEWRAALSSEPNLAEAHYNLGNALADTPGRLPEAIAEYQAAVASEPDLAEAHNNLANALARTPGGMPRAIDEWKAAVRIQPNLLEAHYNLGSALSQMPGRIPEAIAEYEAALRLRPDPELRQTIERLRASQ